MKHSHSNSYIHGISPIRGQMQIINNNYKPLNNISNCINEKEKNNL